MHGGANITITYHKGLRRNGPGDRQRVGAAATQHSCKIGSVVVPVTELLLSGDTTPQALQSYRNGSRLTSKNGVLIPAFSAACILLVILGGCVYGMFTARCGVLLTLPIFNEGTGRSHAGSVASRSGEHSIGSARKQPEASFMTVVPPKVCHQHTGLLSSCSHHKILNMSFYCIFDAFESFCPQGLFVFRVS